MQERGCECVCGMCTHKFACVHLYVCKHTLQIKYMYISEYKLCKTFINILMKLYKSKKTQCLIFAGTVLFNLYALLWTCLKRSMGNSVLYLAKSSVALAKIAQL